MPLASPSSEGGVKRRPKDRKAQIAQASADAFSAQGFHAVSMEDIASRVGVSPAALYRHSHGKYDLFRDAVLTLGQLLVDATAFADDFGPTADPADTLAQVIDALISVTAANRTAAACIGGRPAICAIPTMPSCRNRSVWSTGAFSVH